MIKENFKLEQAVETTINPIVDYYNEQFGDEIEKVLAKRLKSVNNKINKLK
jgi:hypothetical protein